MGLGHKVLVGWFCRTVKRRLPKKGHGPVAAISDGVYVAVRLPKFQATLTIHSLADL